MSAKELRKLSLEDLAAKARELRGEYFNAKVKRSTGQLENTAKRMVLLGVEAALMELRRRQPAALAEAPPASTTVVTPEDVPSLKEAVREATRCAILSKPTAAKIASPNRTKTCHRDSARSTSKP